MSFLPTPFTPEAFGAKGDGITDDIAAFEAMTAAIPIPAGSLPDGNLRGGGALISLGPKTYHLSRTWRVNKIVIIQGQAGFTDSPATQINTPVGVTGIVLEPNTNLYFSGVGRADGSAIRNVSFTSTPLSITVWPGPSAAVSLGAKIMSPWNNNFYLECTTAGTTGAANPIGEPHPIPGTSEIGDFVMYGGAPNQWILRWGATPPALKYWTPSFTYAIGDTFSMPGFLASDGSGYWLEAGAVGDSGKAFPIQPSCPFENVQFTDGSVVWTSRIHSAILAKVACEIDSCAIYNYTNSGLSLMGALGSPNAANPEPGSVSGSIVSTCFIVNVGVGVFITGGDAASCLVQKCQVTGSGIVYQNYFGPTHTRGIAYYDASFLGNTFFACEVQLTSGSAYSIERSTARGMLLSCYAEADTAPDFIGASAISMGGDKGNDTGDGFDYGPVGQGTFLSGNGTGRNLAIANGDDPVVQITYSGRIAPWVQGELVFGNTSGCVGIVQNDNGSRLQIAFPISKNVASDFTNGEVLSKTSGGSLNATCTSTTSISQAPQLVTYIGASGIADRSHFWSLSADASPNSLIGAYYSDYIDLGESNWAAARHWVNFGLNQQYLNTAFSIANTNSTCRLRADIQGGDFWLSNLHGFLFGYPTSKPSRWSLDASTPSTQRYTTDISWNRSAAAVGDYVGYFATADGAPATYLGFGALESPAFALTNQPASVWDGGVSPLVKSSKGRITTTDATTTTIPIDLSGMMTIPNNQTTVFYVDVTAKQTGVNDGAQFSLKAVWEINGGGSPKAIKAPTIVDGNANTIGTAWTAVLDLSGSTARVRVTGDASKTVVWTAVVQAQAG